MNVIACKCDHPHDTWQNTARCIWTHNLGNITGEGPHVVVHLIAGTWFSRCDLLLTETQAEAEQEIARHDKNCRYPIDMVKLTHKEVVA